MARRVVIMRRMFVFAPPTSLGALLSCHPGLCAYNKAETNVTSHLVIRAQVGVYNLGHDVLSELAFEAVTRLRRDVQKYVCFEGKGRDSRPLKNFTCPICGLLKKLYDLKYRLYLLSVYVGARPTSTLFCVPITHSLEGALPQTHDSALHDVCDLCITVFVVACSCGQQMIAHTINHVCRWIVRAHVNVQVTIIALRRGMAHLPYRSPPSR